jgi:hypothetical protein
MSGLSVPGFQSATGATAAIYAKIKKTVGNVPNTFAAIGGHGSAAVKAVPAAGGVPYLHIIVERSTRYAAVVAAGLVLFGLLSPTTVTARQRASVGTDLSVSATATDGASHAVAAKPDRNGTTPLTSHLPWLAPVGHRGASRSLFTFTLSGSTSKHTRLIKLISGKHWPNAHRMLLSFA